MREDTFVPKRAAALLELVARSLPTAFAILSFIFALAFAFVLALSLVALLSSSCDPDLPAAILIAVVCQGSLHSGFVFEDNEGDAFEIALLILHHTHRFNFTTLLEVFRQLFQRCIISKPTNENGCRIISWSATFTILALSFALCFLLILPHCALHFDGATMVVISIKLQR